MLLTGEYFTHAPVGVIYLFLCNLFFFVHIVKFNWWK